MTLQRAAAGGAVVATAVLMTVAVVDSWSPEGWAALAAWVTAAIALAAGIVAVRQLGEARRLRLEQSQPYVVVFLEPVESDQMLLDLVIRNLGATAATSVRVRIDPAPRQAAGGGEIRDLLMPDTIPVLVPGQEWRTFWDRIPDRVEKDLPDMHTAIVEFKDSQRSQEFRFSYELDWEQQRQRGHIVLYGMHHAAKALREINTTTKKWGEGAGGSRGLAVTVRDGDAKDQRVRELRKARAAEGDERQSSPERDEPTTDPGPPSG